MSIFFEVHKDLPREGPGDNASTIRALKCLKDIPEKITLLDVGCGPGMQTVELAKNINGKIVAIDKHQPFLDELWRRAKNESFDDKIEILNKSMMELDFDENSIDVIWSEGSIFIIGFEKGLNEWKRFLKKDGYLVISELTWIKSDRPDEIEAYWHKNGADIKDIEANIAVIEKIGYSVIETFILPEKGWWEDYYIPMESRIANLKKEHSDDEMILQELGEHQLEIDMYRKYSDYYGYVFYILQLKS